MLDDASIGGNPIFSGICCIVLAVILVFVELFVYGSITIYTIFMAAMIVVMGIFLIISWLNQINRIKDHIKRYEGKKVAIVKLCHELQMQTVYFFKILGELRKKKDLKFELDDRTGELIVEKTTLQRQDKISDNLIEKESKEQVPKINEKRRCIHCERELSGEFQFCPSCGRKSNENS